MFGLSVSRFLDTPYVTMNVASEQTVHQYWCDIHNIIYLLMKTDIHIVVFLELKAKLGTFVSVGIFLFSNEFLRSLFSIHDSNHSSNSFFMIPIYSIIFCCCHFSTLSTVSKARFKSTEYSNCKLARFSCASFHLVNNRFNADSHVFSLRNSQVIGFFPNYFHYLFITWHASLLD